MGKGSRARPINDKEKFSDNWDKIFGNKQDKADEKQRKDAEKQKTK